MKHFLLLTVLLFLSCDKETNQEIQNIEYVKKTIQYKQVNEVDANLLSLDVYYTKNIDNKKPIVIYVHGGGWSIGDKSSNIQNKVNLFQSLNYVFVSINYRLSPLPTEPNNLDRVMFPTHNVDVADAIKWVYDTIDQYGGDKNKIALLGHSAGAHLVSLTGTNQSFLKDVGLSLNNIKGVASIDTEGYNVLTKVAQNNSIYINAFGTDTDLNKEASPIFNVKSGVSYPHFFIAKRGGLERLKISNNFIEALEQQNVYVSQIEGSIYNHSEINNAIGKPKETLITEPLKDFFKKCFE